MAEPLKNSYDSAYVERLASAVGAQYEAFDQETFLTLVFDAEWPNRELKDRMYHLAASLRQALPEDYGQALEIVLRAAPPFGSFEGMFFPAFVELYGLEHWELSLPALAQLTRYSSSEFAVRPFIQRDPDRMMAQMVEWAGDSNYHVRRLASEGCRPRLPWATALPDFKADPTPILPILRQLRDDPELYVRRSVANNLNDIAKDHPDLVLDLCGEWSGESEATDWVIKHACRSLLKQGRTEALRLFGFEDPHDVSVEDLTLHGSPVPIGAKIEFGFSLRVESRAKLRVEYAIDFVKRRGQTSRKVFQIFERTCEPGNEEVRRRHSFVDLTTRTHYPGLHRLVLLVNGTIKSELPFEVVR